MRLNQNELLSALLFYVHGMWLKIIRFHLHWFPVYWKPTSYADWKSLPNSEEIQGSTLPNFQATCEYRFSTWMSEAAVQGYVNTLRVSTTDWTCRWLQTKRSLTLRDSPRREIRHFRSLVHSLAQRFIRVVTHVLNAVPSQKR